MNKASKAERKRAEDLGISVGELRLLEILEEINQRLRWAQMLGYATQYVLKWKGLVSQEELDTVLQAVARTIDLEGSDGERARRIAEFREILESRSSSTTHGMKILAREERKRRKRRNRKRA